jgi:hypothetical protein
MLGEVERSLAAHAVWSSSVVKKVHQIDVCGCRHWHEDLRPDDTPLESGLAFICKLKSGIDFQGKDALVRQQKEVG